MDEGPSTRQLSAIMFSDIVGYSKLMGEDEQGTLTLLQEHNDLLVPIIKKYNGTILKFIGDAILSSYESAADAVHCAVEIQRALEERNKPAEKSKRILVRIGIHIGDITRKGGDVFGDGVNIAARIQPLAEPGGICISQTVFHIVQAHPELRMVSLGQRQLKNIREPIGIYEVSSGEGGRRSGAFPWRGLAGAALAALCLGAGLFGYRRLHPRHGVPKFRPGEFGLLVLPFKGMDAETEQEGKVLQSLVGERLDEIFRNQQGIRVISRSSMKAPGNLTHVLEAAKATGASAVLWGEIIGVKDRMQVQPYLAANPSAGFSHNLAPSAAFEIPIGGPDPLKTRKDLAEKVANLGVLAASQYFFPGNPERALSLAEQISPPTAAGLTLRGNILLSLRRTAEAQTSFEKAIGLKGFAPAHEGLGEILMARNKLLDAAAQFQKAAELDPSAASPHSELGLIYALAAQYPKSAEEYKTAVGLDPKTFVPRIHLAALLDLLGRREEAREQFAFLLANDRRSAGALEGGLLYYLSLVRAGQRAQAEGVLGDVLGPNSASEWPGPVGLFLAGRLGEGELLKILPPGDAGEGVRRKCLAYYFIGAKLSLGPPSEAARARSYFEKAVATERRKMVEYLLSQYELQKPASAQKPSRPRRPARR